MESGKELGVCRKGESFAAVYAAGGLTLQETGPDRGRELRSDGRHNLWLIRVSGTDRHDSFDAFVQTMLGVRARL